MTIDVLPGAEEDISHLKRTDPRALAVVLAFLEEAEADPALIDKFASRDEANLGKSRVSVKPWASARQKANLFRIRILDTPATRYRVVYGFDWHQRRIGILAILHKDVFDYEIDSRIADRIFADWHAATDGYST